MVAAAGLPSRACFTRVVHDLLVWAADYVLAPRAQLRQQQHPSQGPQDNAARA